MAILPIRIYGDKCLKEISKPIEEIDEGTRTLISNMADTLYQKSHHIGLAAPQVGVNLRVFMMDVDWIKESTNAERNLQVFINPEILQESEEDEPYPEGCLSLPGIDRDVYRPKEISIRYTDEKGQTHERDLDKLEARCAQHELDHLNGMLFVDRLPFVQRSLLAGKLGRLKKRQRRDSTA